MTGSQFVFQVLLDFGPFAFGKAVHDRVAHGAVAAQGMVPQHAVLAGPQTLYGALRGDVVVVGTPSHPRSAECIARVAQQQQLAGRVDMAALPAFSIPGVADLQAPQGRHDVVIAARAYDSTTAILDNDKRQHMPRGLALQRGLYIGGGTAGFRYRRYSQFP